MNRLDLLNLIMKYQFSAVEINLYLDNFPDNCSATEDYVNISKKLDKLMAQYEESFGPLTNFGSAMIECPPLWASSPWPWENQFWEFA